MNHSIIIYMLGWIMNIEAALMLIPILTAVVYKEGIISCYAGVAVVCAVLGFLCTRKKPKVRMFFCKGRLCTGFLRLAGSKLFWLPSFCVKRGDTSFY